MSKAKPKPETITVTEETFDDYIALLKMAGYPEKIIKKAIAKKDEVMEHFKHNPRVLKDNIPFLMVVPWGLMGFRRNSTYQVYEESEIKLKKYTKSELPSNLKFRRGMAGLTDNVYFMIDIKLDACFKRTELQLEMCPQEKAELDLNEDQYLAIALYRSVKASKDECVHYSLRPGGAELYYTMYGSGKAEEFIYAGYQYYT